MQTVIAKQCSDNTLSLRLKKVEGNGVFWHIFCTKVSTRVSSLMRRKSPKKEINLQTRCSDVRSIHVGHETPN